eukprot:TRINITY_DN10332_c0_g1_i1.p1 TRINITY_DN10332_c0_g1~~TRINITY_DN10332_c0_g1_i1.p1  ORF type:complete len:126 (+),score=21.01 TRINITY_DN10332_c0_g1_i1:63-440(+)
MGSRMGLKMVRGWYRGRRSLNLREKWILSFYLEEYSMEHPPISLSSFDGFSLSDTCYHDLAESKQFVIENVKLLLLMTVKERNLFTKSLISLTKDGTKYLVSQCSTYTCPFPGIDNSVWSIYIII